MDRHRDDPQRHPVQHVDERDDEPEARMPRAPHPAQPEQHPLLVLLHDPRRQGHPQQEQCDDDDNDDFHGDPSWMSRRRVIPLSNAATMPRAIQARTPIADSLPPAK